ncbi:MAG TPA: helix-turn-helix domain-containing protein [Caulobacteraceae bacterium]|jgi:DNA-binding transcriptional regulator YiaG
MNTIDLRYDACGLDNVVLKGLPVLTADDGEEVITIPNIGLLHRVLTVAVATKKSGLTPKELRFLRTELGLSQAELARQVGKEVQAIGRWERGECPIDTAAEIVVRMRVLQEARPEELPLVSDLPRLTVRTADEPQFLIDASDPSHYQEIAA